MQKPCVFSAGQPGKFNHPPSPNRFGGASGRTQMGKTGTEVYANFANSHEWAEADESRRRGSGTVRLRPDAGGDVPGSARMPEQPRPLVPACARICPRAPACDCFKARGRKPGLGRQHAVLPQGEGGKAAALPYRENDPPSLKSYGGQGNEWMITPHNGSRKRDRQ